MSAPLSSTALSSGARPATPQSAAAAASTAPATVRSYSHMHPQHHQQQQQAHANHQAPRALPGTSAPPASAAPQASNNPKKRSWVSSYYEYNLAEMTDSRGGFLTPNAPAAATRNPPSADSADPDTSLAGMKRARTHYPSLDPDTQDKCQECHTSTDLDPRYQDHFHINVCWACKEAVPEKYALLTKTEARQDYLLTDDELKDDILFPHVWRKKNPRKQTFHDMYLYLRAHVEAYAVTKWGSLEAMDAEFERREHDKERRKEEKFKKNLERLRKATRTSLWSGKGNGIAEAADGGGGGGGGGAAGHVHEFQEGEEEGYMVCSCGMVVEGEVM